MFPGVASYSKTKISASPQYFKKITVTLFRPYHYAGTDEKMV
ncbi:hypothetical protein ECL_04986 [Enterobacter cloacae subsp. cloacae ATCC 13047]|uniref:Uncharacterized protein n=1 Tax=Enterobacter cloacae subsp. cloacae (strain ATCC 13047 / DSM 30054 / NBRC 13535 / NCTC 10005 / WDCM 00083 / NCDC 279-56) TaxID=716541 RepID=A0A0H3CTE0_ENTCC|nr:hypothetical protein ECL_04986 [Enterobacter cloacae subsp. cloacae ATCC 13047]